MLRGEAVVVACALCACGRLGFSDMPVVADGGDTKPDAGESTGPDADPSIDAPVGMGSYSVSESTAPYALLEGADTVPEFVPGSDEAMHPIALPFTFRFYGIDYTMLWVHTNGYVTFAPAPANPEPYRNDCPFDASPPDAMIASFWDDLFASKMIMPFGTIRYAITGSSPDRALAVEWHDVDAYYQAGGGNNFFSQGIRITQKIVLHERGVIELHYGPRTGSSTTKDCGTDRHVGCSATVGLRAPSSAVLQSIQCGTDLGAAAGFAPLVEGRLITFTPN